MEVVHTDETFSFTVDVRNDGPDAASDVTVKAGANALSLFLGVEAPKGWTCDTPSPQFGYVVTCTTPSFAPKSAAQFKVNLAASQPFAMTYRISAVVAAKTSDPDANNNRLETNLSLTGAKAHAELSMTARDLAFDIRNDGPDDAKSMTAILAGAKDAKGDGWQCKSNPQSVICTRDALKAGETSSITAHGESIDARVRAEQFWDSNPRNNHVKRKAAP